MRQSNRYLLATGDSTDYDFRGGSLRYFLDAGRCDGFLSDGFSPDMSVQGRHSLLWRAMRLIKGRTPFGYQYSRLFCNKLSEQLNLKSYSGEIISHFPLIPPSEYFNPENLSFYGDATLRQNFSEYGIAQKLSRDLIEDSLARERENYRSCRYVVCRSIYHAESVTLEYGIDPKKVHVVRPGANIPDEVCREREFEYPEISKGIVLGFVGNNPRRKRFDLLLEIAEKLYKIGIPAVIKVIGDYDSIYESSRRVKYIGRIRKALEPERFARELASCHFGCLLSDAEALGVSLIEFQRLGVPVITRSVGGMPEVVSREYGFVLPEPFQSEIACTILEGFFAAPKSYQELRNGIMSIRHQWTWRSTTRKMMQIWDGSSEYSMHDLATSDNSERLSS